MSIPIQNLYYLLCYAWDSLDQADTVDIEQADPKSLVELFGRVLETGTAHLLKRGLDREYVCESKDTSSLRGKLDLTTTIKRNLFIRSRVHCHVDELHHDVLQNQILKTTIVKLVRCENLQRQLKDSLLRTYRRLGDINEIPLTSSAFGQVVLHRNNAHYRLPLEVCRLIHDNSLIDERPGHSRFRDFLREEKAMAAMFEKFVRRFFEREQTDYKVRVQVLPWQGTDGSEADLEYLPTMRTDVCLEKDERKIVIDTKYYQKTFLKFYEKESIRSGHLYQIYSYLRNLEIREGTRRSLEGILLYPTTEHSVSLNYTIHGFKVRIVTLDLDKPWTSIHGQLLSLLN